MRLEVVMTRKFMEDVLRHVTAPVAVTMHVTVDDTSTEVPAVVKRLLDDDTFRFELAL